LYGYWLICEQTARTDFVKFEATKRKIFFKNMCEKIKSHSSELEHSDDVL